MKFRKKPIVIEAIHFDGTNRGDIENFCAPHPVKTGGPFAVIITTPEGQMRANPGDWIIKGVKGEFDSIKDEIFKETYEPAE